MEELDQARDWCRSKVVYNEKPELKDQYLSRLDSIYNLVSFIMNKDK
jgi:hypothetical protein